MRLVISREGLCSHEGSMRCERCFPKILEMKRDGICVLEEADDGSDMLTLVVVEGGKQSTYILDDESLAPFEGESWPVVLEGLKGYEVESGEI